MTLKQEYARERRRIQSFMRAAQKRGFVFETDLLPAIPKRVTRASIRRLSKIKPDYLYAHAVYVAPDTGEAYEATRRLAEVRAAGIRKRRLTLAMKKDREAANARAKRKAQLREETPANIPYYPTEESVGYARLMSILNSAYGSYNSYVMRRFVRDYVNRVGLIAFIKILATDEGKNAIREAEEIAYDSDGSRVRQWTTSLENLFIREGVLTTDELKQFQDIRTSEAWEEVSGKDVTGAERSQRRRDIELMPIQMEAEAHARRMAKAEIKLEKAHAETERARKKLEKLAQ